MRYIRSDFIPSKNVEGKSEKDLLMNVFRSYKFKRNFLTYKLQQDDFMRPDKISLKVYGVQDYWWIILRCNPEIEDIWNDVAGYNETIMVKVSDIDKSSSSDMLVEVEKSEYMFPKAKRIGESIRIPNILDIQELYTYAKSKIK